jgi:hypothetical protein
VQSVGVYPVTVMIYLVVTMAKQNIYISGRAANNRIERAVPQFMAKFGMEREQATATAIRLESLGRLQVSGEPINKPKGTRGKPIPVMPAALQTVFNLMKRDNTPKTTQVTTPPDTTYTNAFAAAASIQRATSTQSTRSNRLRSRVTRGR